MTQKSLPFIRFAVIALMIAAMIIPGIATVAKVASGGEQRRSMLELRRLSTFQQLGARIASGRFDWSTLPGALDSSFEDQLAGRVAITQSVNSTLALGLSHSTADEITIGQDGFWFRTGDSYDMLACASPSGIDENAASALEAAYLGLDQRMAAQGIQLYMLIVPNKAAVYPEELPPHVASRCVERPYFAETMAQRLRADGVRIAFDLDWFRTYPAERLWDRRNYHWTTGGGMAFMSYQFSDGLLSDLDIEPATINWLTRRRSERIDIANRLGVFPMTYDYPYPGIPEAIRGVRNGVEARRVEGDYSAHVNASALSQLRFFEGRPDGLRAMLIGDSFSKRPDEYFARHFSETLVVQTNSMGSALEPGRFDAIIEQYHPDIVLFMFEQAKFEPINGSDRARSWISAFQPPRQ
jgi:hypothetical protein